MKGNYSKVVSVQLRWPGFCLNFRFISLLFLSSSLLCVSHIWSMFDFKQCNSVRCIWIPTDQSHDVTSQKTIIIFLLHSYLKLWCRVLLEKLTDFRLVKQFPKLVKPEDTFPYLQNHGSGPYPEPNESKPHHSIVFLAYLFLYCFHWPPGLATGFFP
jgi:hypothetical protein